MRVTIHLVAPADFWPFALATRDVRRALWLQPSRPATSAAMAGAARTVRRRLAGGGELTRKELEALVGKPRAAGVGLWVDLVRAPPSGTWERRRADRFALAEDWLGAAPALSAAAAGAHLVRRYLTAFGPATRKDVASFTGLALRPLDGLLAAHGAASGCAARTARSCSTCRTGSLPDGDAPAPPRFLPTWDATLLVPRGGTGVLPEAYRPQACSARRRRRRSRPSSSTARWRGPGATRTARSRLEPFAPLSKADAAGLEEEAARLAAFHA